MGNDKDLTFGGRPRFFGTAGVVIAVARPRAASVFLLRLPFGRPRRFLGGCVTFFSGDTDPF